MRFGTFFAERIYTQDRKIHLAPEAFVGRLALALLAPPLPTAELPFLLISGARRSQSFNSWTHNVPALVEKLQGNWATLNDADAAPLGIQHGALIRITSAIGEIEIDARISSKIASGSSPCTNTGVTRTTRE